MSKHRKKKNSYVWLRTLMQDLRRELAKQQQEDRNSRMFLLLQETPDEQAEADH